MTSIDVCLPVHNGAAYLADALGSVVAQTVKPARVIVSDNASDDDTPSIATTYPGVSLSRSAAFLPQGESINRALDLGSAEWLKPLCHDDLLAPDCIGRLADVAAELPPTVGLVGHGEALLFDNGHLHRPAGAAGSVRVFPGREFLRRLLEGSARAPLPALTTALIRRGAWEESDHFDPRYSHCDVFCWVRMLMHWDYAYVDAPLSVNRIHGQQVAVSARATHRSTQEQDGYWNAFVDEFGPDLRLSRRAVARTRWRGAASAGAAAAIQLLKGDPRAAAGVVNGTPARWWPLLPPLTVRAYVRERARIRPLRPHVPLELIYP